jgi:uncharacterized protein (DUF885 family)
VSSPEPTGPVPAHREPTAIDGIAEQWVTTLVDLDPDVAIWIGLPGRLEEFGDFSPEGHERQAAAAQATIAQLDASTPVDEVDAVTLADLRSSLALDVESHNAGLFARDLNVIASPAQSIREGFDLMPQGSTGDWATIAGRLGNVPGALAGYTESLRLGVRTGMVPARRQVAEVAAQVAKHAAADGFFRGFADGARLDDGSELPASLQADLRRGAEASAAAYGEFTDFLRTELAPRATDIDGVGRDMYTLQSQRFLGATVDLDETYDWGVDELARMVDEQTRVASQISPGASVEEAVAILDADPAYKLHGPEELRRWMQQLSDTAVTELSATAFEIPEPVRRIECMIAPTHEGGIYYTGPSDDFSRPGRMWWSVPEGVTEFDTWREKRRCSTRVSPDITCSWARPSTTATRSTPGVGNLQARRATRRDGRCTPNASCRSSVTSTTRRTCSGCSTASVCGPHVWCSTSAYTWANPVPTGAASGRRSTRWSLCAPTST